MRQMRRLALALSPTVWILYSSFILAAQESHPTIAPRNENLKTLIVATESKSDSVVPIPPITSASISLGTGKESSAAGTEDLQDWVRREGNLNGLQSHDLLPWHIVITYEQFDRSGNGAHRGLYEEFWAGTRKYKRIYKSDNLSQTDFATEKGLFRQGDQRWPNRAESQMRSEVVDPFFYASMLQGFHTRNAIRDFGGYKLECVLIENYSHVSDPTQYCFEPGGSVLRYDHGFGWFQTVFNQIITFRNRNLAREVVVTDGGTPYLKMHVEKIELISNVRDADFLPPEDATGPLGDRVSGVSLVPVNAAGIVEWPSALRNQHFTITVEIVIGKDGDVISAHAVSGPPLGYKACESVVRKWKFKPYLVLDTPVEVEEKVECSN